MYVAYPIDCCGLDITLLLQAAAFVPVGSMAGSCCRVSHSVRTNGSGRARGSFPPPAYVCRYMLLLDLGVQDQLLSIVVDEGTVVLVSCR